MKIRSIKDLWRKSEQEDKKEKGEEEIGKSMQMEINKSKLEKKTYMEEKNE